MIGEGVLFCDIHIDPYQEPQHGQTAINSNDVVFSEATVLFKYLPQSMTPSRIRI